MALFDIFKGKKGKDERLKRPPKGALKRPSSEKTKETEAEAEEKTERKATPERISELASFVFLSPHVTEKSTIASGKGVYEFKVRKNANKNMVARAILELYGFKPLKIAMINMPSKKRRVRGMRGTKSGFKKAIIYLKQGDKIELA